MTEVILKFSPNFSVNVLGKKYLKGVKKNNNNKIYSYTGSKSKFLEFLFFDFFFMKSCDFENFLRFSSAGDLFPTCKYIAHVFFI